MVDKKCIVHVEFQMYRQIWKLSVAWGICPLKNYVAAPNKNKNK
jgi:hypothetical protein